LKRLSKIARASVALFGTGTFCVGIPDPFPLGWAESRATVTRGLNSSHSLPVSFGEIRTGTGFRHWKRVDGSKCAHCLQQCKATEHLGQLPFHTISDGSAVEQL